MLRIVYSRDFIDRATRIQIIIDDQDMASYNIPTIELRPWDYLGLPTQLRNLASILEQLEANKQHAEDSMQNGEMSMEELLNTSEGDLPPDDVEEELEEVDMEEEDDDLEDDEDIEEDDMDEDDDDDDDDEDIDEEE